MFNVLEYNAVKPIEQMAPVTTYNKPVVGLDRDGVLNFNAPDGGYVFRPDMFQPIPGALEAVALIRSKGYKIVIITGQAGIHKGLYTQYDVDRVHQYMFELLGQAGCPSVDGLYYSTTNLKEDEYAKPNVGMFKRAERELPGIEFNKGWYVGDSMRDLKAADKIGAKPILVRTGHGTETESELGKFAARELKKKTNVFDNLMEFAQSLT